MQHDYEALKLKNQICFPVYAVSNIITRRYKPLLNSLDLTYTQYIVMMVLWEQGSANEKLLCETLCLKSNTLAPLLKKLQSKGYITKEKDPADERNLIIRLTAEGEKLKEQAACVPESFARGFDLTPQEAVQLYTILYKIINTERKKNK